MKLRNTKISLLTFFILTSLVGNGQTQIWGLTEAGGDDNSGAIFKTDGNGNNQSLQRTFQRSEMGSLMFDLVEMSSDRFVALAKSTNPAKSGSIIEFDIAHNTYNYLHFFDDYAQGWEPIGSLVEGNDGKWYGVTTGGGLFDDGVIFSYDPKTKKTSKSADFNEAFNGNRPSNSMMLASNGLFYGLTMFGGANGFGILYSFDPNTNTISKIIDFDDVGNGQQPLCSLVESSNGKLYGATNRGGSLGEGVLFEFDPSTNTMEKKLDLAKNFSNETPSLIVGGNDLLYGITGFAIDAFNSELGVFSYVPSTNVLTEKLHFSFATIGQFPTGKLTLTPDGKLFVMTTNTDHLIEYDPATEITNTYPSVDNNPSVGLNKNSLLLASNGKLYGMTSGVLFEFDLTTKKGALVYQLYNQTNGLYANGSLVSDDKGNLFGNARAGGYWGFGTLFKFNSGEQSFEKLKDFDDNLLLGSNPTGLMRASDGMFYGTTTYGGAYYSGVIYKFDPTSLIYTKLYDINNFSAVDGASPLGVLLEASNGKFYGLNSQGGNNLVGTIFQFDPITNIYTVLAHLDGVTGPLPSGSLVEGVDGKFYGMTRNGGTNTSGVLFQFDPITNLVTSQLEFDPVLNGSFPMGSLLAGKNGLLYGLTSFGGTSDFGVFFHFDPLTKVFTKILDFNGTSNGGNPFSDMIHANDGNIYGMTSRGGTDDAGIFFQYNPNTNSFVNKVNFNYLTSGTNPAFNGLLEIPISIKTVAQTTNACPNDLINVQYELIGAYDSTNVFTVQLSDAFGSFASPVAIGSYKINIPLELSATIPQNTVGGTGYRIRVVSSSPAVIGQDNGVDITINSLPTVSILSSINNVCAGTNVDFTANSLNAGANPTYNWKVNTTLMGSGATFSSSSLVNGDLVICEMTANGVCSGVSAILSNSIVMQIIPLPSVSLPPFNNSCDTSSIIVLDQGIPSGGTYLVNGIPATTFDPNTAIIGTNTIVYNFIDANNCTGSASSTIIVDLCSSLEEFSKNKFIVYPNASNGFVEIKGTSLSEINQVLLYDNLGRFICDYGSKTKIDLSSFADGSYMLIIKGNAFSEFKTIKLIK